MLLIESDIPGQSVESWDRCDFACNTGCYRRSPPVTPGVTGEHRRCALANGACNTGCYRRLHRPQLSTDCYGFRGFCIVKKNSVREKTFSVRGKLGSVQSPVTPGVTGAVRRSAPAPFARNTGCYRRRSPVTPGVTGAIRL